MSMLIPDPPEEATATQIVIKELAQLNLTFV
jgi:hypothetical protein